VPRLTQGPEASCRIRGYHPLWPAFPDRSAIRLQATGLVRVRSTLLAESLLMSFPPATEMFQFAGFASPTYGFSRRSATCAVQLDIESQIPRPINFQLAPDINRSASLSTNSVFRWNSRPPAVPADQRPTRVSHRPFGGASGQPPTSLGAASDAPPSDQLPTLVEYCLLRLHLRTNFQPFIVCCIFRLHRLANYQLTPAIDLPVLPSDPTASLRRLSRPPALPSNPASDSRRNSHPPALPSNPTSDSSSDIASSDFTFPPTADLRRPSTFRFCPPPDLRLSPASPLRASPSDPASDFHRTSHPPALSATQPSFSIGV